MMSAPFRRTGGDGIRRWVWAARIVAAGLLSAGSQAAGDKAAGLDAAFQDNPVVLLHASDDMLVANTAAMQKAGVIAATPDP